MTSLYAQDFCLKIGIDPTTNEESFEWVFFRVLHTWIYIAVRLLCCLVNYKHPNVLNSVAMHPRFPIKRGEHQLSF